MISLQQRFFLTKLSSGFSRSSTLTLILNEHCNKNIVPILLTDQEIMLLSWTVSKT